MPDDDRCANCSDPRSDHRNGLCNGRRRSGGPNGILQWCGCRKFSETFDPNWWRQPY
jgi:hypothetical protein